MFQGFQDFDLAQRGHRHAFLLVVHQDALEGDRRACGFVDGFMHFSG